MSIARTFIHKMIERRYSIDTNTVLNNHSEPVEGEGSMPERFHAIFQQMKALAFPREDGRVDYDSLRGSGILAAYREATRRLPRLTPADLATREERLAFWINLYNGLILDAALANDVQESVQDIPGFFWKAGYQIGGCRFSAFDIEYGILRANAGHPTIPGPQIPLGDERLAFRVEKLDTRVHFALVCAARSCPDLRIYSAEHIDDQLDEATRRFINGKGVKFEMEKNTVWLSKIFQWYAQDFDAGWQGIGNPNPLLAYIAQYRNDTSEAHYLTHHQPKVRYLDYDWTLNR